MTLKQKRSFIVAGVFLVIAVLIAVYADVGPTARPSGAPAYVPPIEEAEQVAAPVRYKDLVIVDEPISDAVVMSPLVVSGQARGNWYFEATFPIRLLDADGNELVSWYAEARSEWMTTEYVPFRAVLEFDAPTTTGTLVLHKSNASGLPEHDDELRIPVRFR